MFGQFKRKNDINNDDKGKETYDPDRVIVYYEGEVLSADYAAETLVLTGGRT